MNLIKALIIGLILNFQSCATKQRSSENLSFPSQAIKTLNPLKAPDIAYQPEKAFFPLRLDHSDNKIKPSFQSEVCTKKFIFCVEWENRLLFFPDLEWFLMNGFGLYKLPDIK